MRDGEDGAKMRWYQHGGSGRATVMVEVIVMIMVMVMVMNGDGGDDHGDDGYDGDGDVGAAEIYLCSRGTEVDRHGTVGMVTR